MRARTAARAALKFSAFSARRRADYQLNSVQRYRGIIAGIIPEFTISNYSVRPGKLSGGARAHDTSSAAVNYGHSVSGISSGLFLEILEPKVR